MASQTIFSISASYLLLRIILFGILKLKTGIESLKDASECYRINEIVSPPGDKWTTEHAKYWNGKEESQIHEICKMPKIRNGYKYCGGPREPGALSWITMFVFIHPAYAWIYPPGTFITFEDAAAPVLLKCIHYGLSTCANGDTRKYYRMNKIKVNCHMSWFSI